MYTINIIPRVLHFKQPAGTSRGSYTTRNVWYIHLSSIECPGRVGVGECAPLPKLSCDDLPDYEQVLRSACQRLEQTGELDIESLRGYPSILFGLVGYTLLIYQFGLGRSLLCSAICVAVMIVPFIAIRAEKILKEKGTEYMKNSLALGMSREYAVIRLILPVCAVELLGTVALGMAYGMGAVAPILEKVGIILTSAVVSAILYHLLF